MFSAIKSRLFQGYRTGSFPDTAPNLPAHFQGAPHRNASACTGCDSCVNVCPTGAIDRKNGTFCLDLGKCVFCTRCSEICPNHALSFSPTEYQLGCFSRDRLRMDPSVPFVPDPDQKKAIGKLFGRSLKIRQVSAGGCAACELDFNVLHTLAWDIGRFGIQAVASPRHADAVLVTGPVSRNMVLALEKTVRAMAKPSCVIACGSCAISGGLYAEHEEECLGGADKILPVDLYVPGCPPHPAVLLDALLRFIGRLP